jgi:hypothetical protein
MHNDNFGLGLLLSAVIVAIYLLPAFVAYGRNHHNKGAILLLDLFLGWTALGWLGALIWSATAIRLEIQKRSQILKFQ